MRGFCSPTGIPGSSAASRTALLSAAAFAAACLCLQGRASAQTLPQLTITALSVTSERTSAPEGQAFHLTIHVHAKQRNADLSSLILPDVTDLTILGDEKRTAPGGSGTDYLEVLTVAGVAAGDATVSPAYIDARDPTRGDRPFRFSSNTLTLRITGAAVPATAPWEAAARKALQSAGVAAAGASVLVLLGFVIGRVARGRRARVYMNLPPARPVVAQGPATVRVDTEAAVREAAATLARSRTRARAASLRSALFAYAGARTDETLSSLLARIPGERGRLRAALRAAERATFVDEPNLQGAIEELLEAVNNV